jgi:hypothetical protein
MHCWRRQHLNQRDTEENAEFRADGVSTTGTLFVRHVLGGPAPRGGLDPEELHITLECRYGKYSGTGKSGWFVAKRKTQ